MQGAFERITRKYVASVLDPTMLFDKTKWEKIERKPEGIGDGDYLFMYALGYKWCQDIEEQASIAAVMIAEKYGLRIVHNYFGDWKNRFSEDSTISFFYGPEEFLWLVHHARFIVCCSFHGTVFSILYERPFITFNIPGNGERIRSLLETVKLQNRLLNSAEELEGLDNLELINWDEVRGTIEDKRNESIEFLNDSIVSEDE